MSESQDQSEAEEDLASASGKELLSPEEVGVLFDLPEFLIRDFISFEFNGKKLKSIKNGGRVLVQAQDAASFLEHLSSEWPEKKRQPPDYVVRYLDLEAEHGCALCRKQKPNYEVAHIEPWSKTRCHSPHNLLQLCLDCHTNRGSQVKTLKAAKELARGRIRSIAFHEAETIREQQRKLAFRLGVAAIAVTGLAALMLVLYLRARSSLNALRAQQLIVASLRVQVNVDLVPATPPSTRRILAAAGALILIESDETRHVCEVDPKVTVFPAGKDIVRRQGDYVLTVDSPLLGSDLSSLSRVRYLLFDATSFFEEYGEPGAGQEVRVRVVMKVNGRELLSKWLKKPYDDPEMKGWTPKVVLKVGPDMDAGIEGLSRRLLVRN